MRIISFLAVILLAAAAQAESWRTDKPHSHLTFNVDNLGFSLTQGQFRKFSADIEMDPESIEEATVNFVIDAGSIDTNAKSRDKNLRGKDFLNVDSFPEISFTSNAVRLVDDRVAEVTGEVTLLGETHEETFQAELIRIAPDPFKPERNIAGFAVTGSIDRTKYGMTYGAPAIGANINIRLDLQLLPK
ncbi:MAG: YceI family protein [Pseudomonadota bacterium]